MVIVPAVLNVKLLLTVQDEFAQVQVPVPFISISVVPDIAVEATRVKLPPTNILNPFIVVVLALPTVFDNVPVIVRFADNVVVNVEPDTILNGCCVPRVKVVFPYICKVEDVQTVVPAVYKIVPPFLYTLPLTVNVPAVLMVKLFVKYPVVE